MKACFSRLPGPALLLLAGAFPLGCSSGAQESTVGLASGNAGSIEADLQIDPGVALNSVAYSITGPGFSTSGNLDVASSAGLTAVISPIPAGAGFVIRLDSTSTDGATTCGGDAAFDVAAGETTVVAVHLTCHREPRTGSVLLSGSLNVCPFIDGIGAYGLTVPEGTLVPLKARVHDLDHGPEPVRYEWTTNLGTLTDPTLVNPVLTCSPAGNAGVTVTVSDGDTSCSTSGTIFITCTP